MNVFVLAKLHTKVNIELLGVYLVKTKETTKTKCIITHTQSMIYYLFIWYLD